MIVLLKYLVLAFGASVLLFLVGMLRICFTMSETRGMTKIEIKKSEQEICNSEDFRHNENYPGVIWNRKDSVKLNK